ncbi:related to MAK11 protein (maintenance of killer toxin-encoding satellite M1 dsRNA) [Ramularia collo-cygni]|uniref:Related to MAK11 protein (Maintenance of killer toxin-encoding satellite M1 dsRNA) n=1 Tax=Ramularia collo-cygni TaxID=112498 RepID=A0A2D3USZ6_9PEZI|nr:related to MAK11 protein (maintenance of killer toxin-encoding satellite M1 dsRNA) [Ramularia collo-cygni]CZT18018.1 related to MAK11 protein (maintenance of killer toxin-encoding satellite M1 dsRNA) [Ramularia collo-cygni]
MATAIGKRKRVDAPTKANPVKKVAVKSAQKSAPRLQGKSNRPPQQAETPAVRSKSDIPIYIQVVTGSYERVLHGLSARIPQSKLDVKQDDTVQNPADEVSFTNSFLFAAHSSAIRCLALSPPTEADKCLLATGSSDERINVYSLSTAPPSVKAGPHLPSLLGTATVENFRNKSLGSLTHHDRAINTLQFPTKSKLFSAAEDATISISRTRDWTVLSSIKAPIPKPQGRPSGDTAGPGEVPAGVNDFAVHPSQKLMLSVGRGERCMRLWNLMTGKKAGVLNFDRDLLIQAGESKFSSGEGRRVLWDETGEHYVIGFERGAALFGIDSKPKAVIRPSSKVHQMRFLPLPDLEQSILAISTEDGRILFYDVSTVKEEIDAAKLPLCPCVAQLGGAAMGISGRVKDFEIVALKGKANILIVTGSSDGAVRLWTVSGEQLAGEVSEDGPKQVGKLVATQETGNRITCLGAFVMDGKASDEDEVEENGGAEEDEESDDSQGDS